MTEEPRPLPRQRRTTPPQRPGEDATLMSSDAANSASADKPRTRRSRATLPPAPVAEAPASGTGVPSSTVETASGASAVTTASRTSPLRRRASQRGRPRESGIAGLAERARAVSDQRPLLPLPDPLAAALPAMRAALLNAALDDALRTLVETLSGALAPAAAQVWIADPIPWTSEQGRVGGLELFPTLRPRALAQSGSEASTSSIVAPTARPGARGGESLPHMPARPDALIEEVATTRNAAIHFAADDHPLAASWVSRLSAPPDATPGAARLGTLAAYPLRVRGQFLGVLAIGTGHRLMARHLTTLEDLADLAALAADRDRLLSYSRSQEALAQTVVRHAPVAVAVLTGADHVFALTNPAFIPLLGLDSETPLAGLRLRDAVPERAERLIASLRLDAVYTGGEPQAMLELPILLDRGMTYW
ncbi:MAG: GAF domain-containing protein, partial [Ktedonobacterales bacterium]